MKRIQPINIWIKGELIPATFLSAYGLNVMLNKSSSFSYSLLDENMKALTSGTLIMGGDSYSQWDDDDFAWNWIASQLNITIIPD